MRSSILLAATSLCTFASAAVLQTQNAQILPPRGSVRVSSKLSEPVDTSVDDHVLDEPVGSVQTLENYPASFGVGCDDRNTVVQIADQGDMLDIIYNEFWAALTPGQKREERRRFCTTTFNLTVPAGYTFGLDFIDWQGYVSLDNGVLGVFNTKFGLADNGYDASIRKVLTGPLVDHFVVHTDTDLKGGIKFLPCSTGKEAALTVSVALQVQYGRMPFGKSYKDLGKGLIGLDEMDSKLKQVLKLNWQKCAP